MSATLAPVADASPASQAAPAPAAMTTAAILAHYADFVGRNIAGKAADNGWDREITRRFVRALPAVREAYRVIRDGELVGIEAVAVLRGLEKRAGRPGGMPDGSGLAELRKLIGMIEAGMGGAE
jgi:hypothetical protein